MIIFLQADLFIAFLLFFLGFWWIDTRVLYLYGIRTAFGLFSMDFILLCVESSNYIFFRPHGYGTAIPTLVFAAVYPIAVHLLLHLISQNHLLQFPLHRLRYRQFRRLCVSVEQMLMSAWIETMQEGDYFAVKTFLLVPSRVELYHC